jgi:hypothetical protein
MIDKRPCNLGCEMSPWGKWEPCSLPCGGGKQVI